MAVFYDEQRIFEDIKSEDVCDFLGIEKRRKGSRYSILCPEHRDNHFGSCFLTPKGYHCFVCNKTESILELVKLTENCDKREALEIMADCLGGKEHYIKSKSKNTKISDNVYLPLTKEELQCIGLKNYSGLTCIFNATDAKIEKEVTEDYYTDTRKTSNSNSTSLETIYVRKKQNHSLLDLMKEDYECFYQIVLDKIRNKLEQCQIVSDMLAYCDKSDEKIYQLVEETDAQLDYVLNIYKKFAKKEDFVYQPSKKPVKKFAVVQQRKELF